MNKPSGLKANSRKRQIATRILTMASSFVVALFPGTALAIEEPAYTSEIKEGKLEIRRYAPSIVAEVVVTGPWRGAANDAFRLLADYIFGNNTKSGKVAMTAPVGMESAEGANSGESQKIAMTAPVGMEKESSKIAMTAPVGMEREGRASGQTSESAQDAGGNGPWRMSFTMPSEFTMDTLPKPNNPKVQIRQLPERVSAVIRFSGAGTEERFATREKELREWIAAKGYTIIGKPNYSQYNPPWTPGFMRRNEVIIPVKKSESPGK